MSLNYNPYGLQPALHESGILRPAPTPGTIASGYATQIFMNSPVQIDSGTPSGNLILATALGAAGAGAAANRIVGAFQGVEYTLTADGRRHVSNQWPSGTVATNIVAWYTRDPNMTYEIQANGSVPATAMGAQASITANTGASGNTTTGFSTVGLDVQTAGSLTQASTNQLRIVGFSQAIDNAPGDAYTVVQVKIAMHQDVANQIAY